MHGCIQMIVRKWKGFFKGSQDLKVDSQEPNLT